MASVTDALLIVVVLCCFVPTPEGMSQSASEDIPAHVVARVLHEGGASGGIEVNLGCGDEQKIAYSNAAGATVEGKLKALRASIPMLRWEKNTTGYRIEIGKDRSESLMQIVIPPTTLVFGDPKDATNQLLGKQEVEANVMKTHLKLFAPSVGYSRVRSTSADKQIELTLPNGTIADDLDRIGKSTGETVWLYSTYDCDGTRNGQILWLKQQGQ